MGIAAQRIGSVRAVNTHENIIIRGRPNVSGLQFAFYPHDLMQVLVKNDWPVTVELHEQPYESSVEGMSIHITGLKRLHASLIESAFVHYFESFRPEVEAKYGTDVQSWPTEWDFGRVVRNAFAHGGKIDIRNDNAPPVAWKTLTYTSNDNGRQIIYQDVTPVEIILLMEDMDAVI